MKTDEQITRMMQTLQNIEADPDSWNNKHYRNQGTCCFAARVALDAGATWWRPTEYVDPYVDWFGHEVHCRTVAKELLGLSQSEAVELFQGTNSLDDLRRIVERHVTFHELSKDLEDA